MRWMPRHGKALVCVKWNDAHGSASTAFSEGNFPHNPYPMETYGLLLRNDEKGVSIACETYYDDVEQQQNYRGHTFIPKGMIIEVKPLATPSAPPKPRKKATPTPEVDASLLEVERHLSQDPATDK